MKTFIKTYYSKDKLTAFKEAMPDEFSNPEHSPTVLRAFMTYSPLAEHLAQRWGLAESWHYKCPDFPIPIKYYPVRPKSGPDYKGIWTIEVDLTRPKEELLRWFEFQIDQFRPRKRRGKDLDLDFSYKVYDLYQERKNYWHITCELFPEVVDQDHNLDPEAKSRYEQVRRAYQKAKETINSIIPA